jgi:hypothetical protein
LTKAQIQLEDQPIDSLDACKLTFELDSRLKISYDEPHPCLSLQKLNLLSIFERKKEKEKTTHKPNSRRKQFNVYWLVQRFDCQEVSGRLLKCAQK